MANKKQVILTKEKTNIKQETNFVELSTSQNGKVLVTVGIGGTEPIDDIIKNAVSSYHKAITLVSVDFSVANEPLLKTEITTSAKGFPQVTVSGESKLFSNGIEKQKANPVAERYTEIVNVVTSGKRFDI